MNFVVGGGIIDAYSSSQELVDSRKQERKPMSRQSFRELVAGWLAGNNQACQLIAANIYSSSVLCSNVFS